MKKLISSCMIFALLVLGGCGMQNSESPSSTEKQGYYPGTVKVGHLVAIDMAYLLFIGKEAGYFAEEGLDVESVFFTNPGDNNTALVNGDVQFNINPFTLPYLADNAGIPMTILAGGGSSIMEVVIQGDQNISTIDQLVDYVKKNPGKKLKVGTLKGDTLDMIIYKSFKDKGLSYDDFEMVWFNDLLAMVQSFQTKQIDILSHIKPYTTDLVVNFDAKKLTDNTEVRGLGTPNCTLNAMDDFVAKYPETIKAYLRAVRKSFELARDNPAQVVQLLQKGNYYKVDAKVLEYVLQTSPQEIVMKPNVQGMMQAIDDMVAQGYIKTPSKNIVNTSFLDALGYK